MKKQAENNQMDLLLRSLAGREETRSAFKNREAEDRASGTHLDADELSSYSERALPAATHARYTAHLADCPRCRKIVSQLVSASGRSVSDQPAGQASAPGFWDRVRAVLTPAVLRYAVPALALFAVFSIGLVAFWQQRPSDLVAQKEQPTADSFVTENKQAQPLLTDSSSPSVARTKPSAEPESSTVSGRGAGETTGAGEKTRDEQKNELAKQNSPVDSVSVTSDKDAAAGKAAGGVAQPLFAPDLAAAPPPPKPQATVAQEKPEAARREGSAETVAVARPSTDERARKAEDKQSQVTVSEVASAPGANQRTQGLRAVQPKRADTAKAKKADEEAEIRTVGGRRFSRQGSVWVDTSYQASMGTTTVARGSEQYRALVADEPGIRKIADQLDGEVVLVWKGRAYRIR